MACTSTPTACLSDSLLGYTILEADRARQVLARVFAAWHYVDTASRKPGERAWMASLGAADPIVGSLREPTCTLVLMRKTARYLWNSQDEEVLQGWSRKVIRGNGSLSFR